MFLDSVDGVENSTSALSTHSPIPASIGGNLMNSVGTPKGLVEPSQQFPDFSGQIPDFQGLCGGILKNSDFPALSGGILKNADFSGVNPKNFGISSMLM